MGHNVHNIDINNPLAICHLPGTAENGIHTWRAHFSSLPVAIEGEHLPTEVGLQCRTGVRSSPWWRWRACRLTSLRRFLTVCKEMILLCKPTVSSAVRVAGLRQSCRWRSQMWRSWAGVVTRGQWLWSWLDIQPNSLKRRRMVWQRNSYFKVAFYCPHQGAPV